MMNPGSLEVQYLHEQLAAIYPRSPEFLSDEEHRMPTDEKIWRQRDFFNNLAGMTLEERERLHQEMMENVFLSPLYVPPKTRESEKKEEPVKEAIVVTKEVPVESNRVIKKSGLFAKEQKKYFATSAEMLKKTSDEKRLSALRDKKEPALNLGQVIAGIIFLGAKIIEIKNAMEA